MQNLLFVIFEVMQQPFFMGFWAVFVFYASLGLAFYIAKPFKGGYD